MVSLGLQFRNAGDTNGDGGLHRRPFHRGPGAGDLNGDGFDDVVLSAPPYRSPPAADTAGRISVYAGGRLQPGPAPYLPEPVRCAKQSPSEPRVSELTLDGELLARSIYLQNQFFPEDARELLEGCVAAPGMRKLLRFSVSIPNVGSATALVPGPTQATELYKFDTCHGHHHLTNCASASTRPTAWRRATRSATRRTSPCVSRVTR